MKTGNLPGDRWTVPGATLGDMPVKVRRVREAWPKLELHWKHYLDFTVTAPASHALCCFQPVCFLLEANDKDKNSAGEEHIKFTYRYTTVL